MILVVRHIPCLLLPINFTGPWYHGKGLQVIKDVKSLLVRKKRVVVLIITGIVAVITTIITMAMASTALSQSIKNVHYANTLSQNVTYTLQQQVSIDEKMCIC
jgi:fluoride ion exporter CrcB/FEX